MNMLERLQQLDLILILVLLGVVATFILFYLRVSRDIVTLSDGLRILMRTGRAPEGMTFFNAKLENIWRRFVSYYASNLRTRESKNEISKILSGGRGILEAGLEEDRVLEVLCDVLYQSVSPEAVFVAVATKDVSWKVACSKGVSKSRLENPILIALEKMPLEHRDSIYTQASNGMEYDFRALGVGLSLFVPLRAENLKVEGVVWVGFSEKAGSIPESRKQTLELITLHATASYLKSKERTRDKKLDKDRREEMLAISHDIKAPGTRALYAVRELDNMLEARGMFEDKFLVQEIELALVEQVELIDQIFNVDEKMSATEESYPEIDIGAILKSRVDTFRVVAKGVGLSLSYEERVRARAQVSRGLIHRILDNLISNSIKYSSEGVVSVVLAGEGRVLRIEVRDQGRGVDELMQKSLFSTKIRNTDKVEGQGHRYGLTVVRSLVEQMGGRVGFMPNIPRGSVFYIELPATKITPIVESRDVGLRVLVVDDDQLVRCTHERWLAGLGLRAHGAETFRDAVNYLSISKPDLIITDYNVPGDEFSRFMQLVPEDVPVVLVSGRASSGLEAETRNYPNIISVLEKPLSKAKLKDMLGLLGTHQELSKVA